MTYYDLVFKVYSENIDNISKRIEKSKFPITFEVLKKFLTKIDDIFKSLEILEGIQCYYSSQALTRILYEHYLVAYYIWTKCRVNDSDECATDYNQYYAFYEMMKQENYNAKLDRSYDSTKSPLQNFLIKAPEFDDHSDPLTEADVIDYNRRANQFDIRHIFRYLQNDLDEQDDFKSINVLVHDVCKRYNKISSYVHGGRLADLETFENTPANDKYKVLKENLEFGRIFSRQLRSFIMLLIIKEDKSFLEIFRPIYDFMIAHDERST
ncbi:hypothetical protein EON73_04725 [bacterium]|nr:MAG: hypothetical protein EON73_04725 [bacterium]